MKAIPDVLGYRLDDALSILNSNSFKIIIKETVSKKSNKSGDARVLQLRNLTDDEIEIIISYF